MEPGSSLPLSQGPTICTNSVHDILILSLISPHPPILFI